MPSRLVRLLRLRHESAYEQRNNGGYFRAEAISLRLEPRRHHDRSTAQPQPAVAGPTDARTTGSAESWAATGPGPTRPRAAAEQATGTELNSQARRQRAFSWPRFAEIARRAPTVNLRVRVRRNAGHSAASVRRPRQRGTASSQRSSHQAWERVGTEGQSTVAEVPIAITYVNFPSSAYAIPRKRLFGRQGHRSAQPAMRIVR